MDKQDFDRERRRLQQEMEAAIEQIRATYQLRLDAIDRAEQLMKLAAGGLDTPADSEPRLAESAPPAPEAAPVLEMEPGELRQELARRIAGSSEPFGVEDLLAKLPGVPSSSVRTCLAHMAKDGEVRIVQAGGPDQPTLYEAPEPRYDEVKAHS